MGSATGILEFYRENTAYINNSIADQFFIFSKITFIQSYIHDQP